MTHDLLGEIKLAADNTGDHVASVEYESRKIEFRMIPDGEPFETNLQHAVNVVSRLKELDKAAKRIIVADLRDTYNSGWNEYDEAQGDGSWKVVSNPQLSESEFEEKFALIAVNVTGSEMVDFFYDDSRLFWGHGVYVTSMNGTDFSEGRADLFG